MSDYTTSVVKPVANRIAQGCDISTQEAMILRTAAHCLINRGRCPSVWGVDDFDCAKLGSVDADGVLAPNDYGWRFLARIVTIERQVMLSAVSAGTLDKGYADNIVARQCRAIREEVQHLPLAPVRLSV